MVLQVRMDSRGFRFRGCRLMIFSIIQERYQMIANPNHLWTMEDFRCGSWKQVAFSLKLRWKGSVLSFRKNLDRTQDIIHPTVRHPIPIDTSECFLLWVIQPALFCYSGIDWAVTPCQANAGFDTCFVRFLFAIRQSWPDNSYMLVRRNLVKDMPMLI